MLVDLTSAKSALAHLETILLATDEFIKITDYRSTEDCLIHFGLSDLAPQSFYQIAMIANCKYLGQYLENVSDILCCEWEDKHECASIAMDNFRRCQELLLNAVI